MALPFDLTEPYAAQLGLIVLETDETMENEFRRVMPPAVSLHHTRIPSEPDVTPETLARMAAHLPEVAATLPGPVRYDVVGYGCTSGATVIGEDRVAALVREAQPDARVTNPISAVMAGMRALGARRIGLLTPYVPAVSSAMQALLEAQGFEIAGFGSFEQVEERVVARIDEASTLAAMLEVGSAPEVEAVFASCTNLRAFGIIDEAERRLGKPVMSSNSALAWHMLALAGQAAEGPGRLFSLR